MWKAYLAALLNFFFPGAGYLLGSVGVRRLLGVPWLIGVIGLTYVETTIGNEGNAMYFPMFASVLIMNTAFAIDAFLDTKANLTPTPATA